MQSLRPFFAATSLAVLGYAAPAQADIVYSNTASFNNGSTDVSTLRDNVIVGNILHDSFGFTSTVHADSANLFVRAPRDINPADLFVLWEIRAVNNGHLGAVYAYGADIPVLQSSTDSTIDYNWQNAQGQVITAPGANYLVTMEFRDEWYNLTPMTFGAGQSYAFRYSVAFNSDQSANNIFDRPSNIGGDAYATSFDSGDPMSIAGLDMAFQLTSSVPAPSSLALIGLAGLAANRRRR